MTDLEICKRIAEIEGLKIDNDPYLCGEPFYLASSASKWMIDSFDLHENCISFTFNPLTDKALCFDLMIKHRISFEEIFSIETSESVFFVATWFDGEHYHEAQDKNPQRAICLAIIAKHDMESQK